MATTNNENGFTLECLMNVAKIQLRNGYNQYNNIALDSTFVEAKLRRLRLDRCQNARG